MPENLTSVVDLRIGDIIRNPAFQMRAAGLSSEHADDLKDVLLAGGSLPPAQVWKVEGIGHILVDGFHTVEAHRRADKATVPCHVREGSKVQALLAATAANREHDQSGLKRTHSDKRRAVALILRTFKDWSDRKVAEHVGVSHPLVAKVRGELSKGCQLETNSSSQSSDSSREGTDGKVRGPKHCAPLASQPLQSRGLGVFATVSSPSKGEPQRPKPGSVIRDAVSDWHDFEARFGRLARGLESISDHSNFRQTSECRQMEQLLNEFAVLLKRVKPRFTKRKETE